MSELKPLICKQCGGHIDRDKLVCNSCGTAYRLDNDYLPVRIELSRAKIQTLTGSVLVPAEYHLKANDLAEYSLRKMAEQMAERIMPLIDLQTEFDMKQNAFITHGRLRAIDPQSI